MSSHDEFWWFGPQKPWHPAITWQEKTKPCKPVKILDAYIFHDPSRSILGLRQNFRLPNHADAANEGQVGWRSHQLGNSWCVGRQNHKVQVLAQIMAQERSVRFYPLLGDVWGWIPTQPKWWTTTKKTTAKQRWFHQEDNSHASYATPTWAPQEPHVPPRRNRRGTGAKNGRCRLRKTAANGVKGDICVSYRQKGAVNLEQKFDPDWKVYFMYHLHPDLPKKPRGTKKKVTGSIPPKKNNP